MADPPFSSHMTSLERNFASLRRQLGSSISSLPGNTATSNEGFGAFVGIASGRAHRSIDKEKGLSIRCDSRRSLGDSKATSKENSPRNSPRGQTPYGGNSNSMQRRWNRAASPAVGRRPSPFLSRGDSSTSASARPLALGFGLFGGDNDPLQAKRHDSPSPSRVPATTGCDTGRKPHATPGGIPLPIGDSGRVGNFSAISPESTSTGVPPSSGRSMQSPALFQNNFSASKSIGERPPVTPERQLGASMEVRSGGSLWSPSHLGSRPPLPTQTPPTSMSRGRHLDSDIRNCSSSSVQNKPPPLHRGQTSNLQEEMTETLVASMPSSQGTRLDGPRYRIKLMSSHHGQPCGWYLDAHRAISQDIRNENSTYCSLHKAGAPEAAGEWVFEESSARDRYKIRLASSHHRQPANWYLDARREHGHDRRSGCSSYAFVHSLIEPDSVGEWAFERGSVANRYTIKFVSSHQGQPAGWFLDAFRSSALDERTEESTYAAVHSEGHRDWTVEWEVEPVASSASAQLNTMGAIASESTRSHSSFQGAKSMPALPQVAPDIARVSRPRSNSPLRDSMENQEKLRWPTGDGDSSNESPDTSLSKSPVHHGRPPVAPFSSWPSSPPSTLGANRFPPMSPGHVGRSQSSSPLSKAESKVSARENGLEARSRSSSPLRRAAPSPCSRQAESPVNSHPQLPRGWGATTAFSARPVPDPSREMPEPTFGVGESVEHSPTNQPQFGGEDIVTSSSGLIKDVIPNLGTVEDADPKCRQSEDVVSPPSEREPMLQKTTSSPSPMSDSLGSVLNIVEPLLEQLLRDTPREKGGVPGGGPEATPEGTPLPHNMRSSVVTALVTMTKTVRELAVQVQHLKDENMTLRSECEDLRALQNSQLLEPTFSATFESSPASTSLRLLPAATSKQFGRQDFQEGKTEPSSSMVHQDEQASGLPPTSPKTAEGQEDLAPAEESNEVSQIAKTRIATLNDDLGKALLKLQRSPEEHFCSS